MYIKIYKDKLYITRPYHVCCASSTTANKYGNARRVLSKHKSTVIINVAFSGSVPYLRDKNARGLRVTREHM